MKQTPQIKRHSKLQLHLRDLLDDDETIIHIVKQKTYVFIIWPEYIVCTNKRLIFCRPETFGTRLSCIDYIWNYIEKCTLYNKTIGTRLSVQLINGVLVDTNYLPEEYANKLYNDITKMIDRK